MSWGRGKMKHFTWYFLNSGSCECFTHLKTNTDLGLILKMKTIKTLPFGKISKDWGTSEQELGIV